MIGFDSLMMGGGQLGYNIVSVTAQQLTPTPTPTPQNYYFKMTGKHNGWTYNFGGFNGSSATASVQKIRFTDVTPVYQTLTSMPAAWYAACGKVPDCNGKLAFFGGVHTSVSYYLTVLDTATDTLNTYTYGTGYARYVTQAAWDGAKYLYVYSGVNYVGTMQNDILRFDMTASPPTLTVLTPTGMTGRKNGDSVWYNGKMYIWGGQDSSSVRQNTLLEFDPVANTVTSLSQVNAPTARFVHRCTIIGSNLIVIGGDDGVARGDAYSVNLDDPTLTWVQIGTGLAAQGIVRFSLSHEGEDLEAWVSNSSAFTAIDSVYKLTFAKG